MRYLFHLLLANYASSLQRKAMQNVLTYWMQGTRVDSCWKVALQESIDASLVRKVKDMLDFLTEPVQQRNKVILAMI